MSDDAMGLTQRELLMEMREDIRGLRASVDAIARDQALGVGMRGRGDIAGRVRKTGRGERTRASLTQRSLSFLMINATPRERTLTLEARSA